MSRLEPALVGLFGASWLAGVACALGLVPVEPEFDVGYYGLFGFAASLGWVAGNVHVRRSRGQPGPTRRLSLVIYLLGPPGLVYLLWSLAPAGGRAQAPLIPVYSFLVFGIFFLVPVAFRPRGLRG